MAHLPIGAAAYTTTPCDGTPPLGVVSLAIPPTTPVAPSQVPSGGDAATLSAAQLQRCCAGCAPGDAGCPAACPAEYNGLTASKCPPILAALCTAPVNADCAPVAGAAAGGACSGLGSASTRPGCQLFLQAGVPPSTADAIKTAHCCANPTLPECAALQPARNPWASALSGGKTYSQVMQEVFSSVDQATAQGVANNAACWWWPYAGGLGAQGGEGALVTSLDTKVAQGCTTAELCAAAVSSVSTAGGAATTRIRQTCSSSFAAAVPLTLIVANQYNDDTPVSVQGAGGTQFTVPKYKTMAFDITAPSPPTVTVGSLAVDMTAVASAGNGAVATKSMGTMCPVGMQAACDVGKVPASVLGASCQNTWMLLLTPADNPTVEKTFATHLKKLPCPLSSGTSLLPPTWTVFDAVTWGVTNLSALSMAVATPDPTTTMLAAGSTLAPRVITHGAGGFTLGAGVSFVTQTHTWPAAPATPTATAAALDDGTTTAVAFAGLRQTFYMGIFPTLANAQAYVKQVQARPASQPLLAPANSAPTSDVWDIQCLNRTAHPAHLDGVAVPPGGAGRVTRAALSGLQCRGAHASVTADHIPAPNIPRVTRTPHPTAVVTALDKFVTIVLCPTPKDADTVSAGFRALPTPGGVRGVLGHAHVAPLLHGKTVLAPGVIVLIAAAAAIVVGIIVALVVRGRRRYVRRTSARGGSAPATHGLRS